MANLGNAAYDLDGDGDADETDLTFLVHFLVALQDGSGRLGTEMGDFNLDGLTNGTDLSLMNANFGLAGGWAAGNANTDGIVNGTDLSILAGSFGFAAPTAPVPEPATFGLLLLGGLAAVTKKRRSAHG